MRRLLSLTLLVVIVLASVLLLRLTVLSPSSLTHLARTPNSAYKYNLCTQAYAYAFASPDNPFKTDYTFPDPFRHANDTIIPRLMGTDMRDDTVSFTVKIVVSQVAVYNETIGHVHELDGISILLPNAQDHLQRSGVPQFIVSSLNPGRLAVLDYTCPDQWVWKAI
jgi:hypothetical protein